MLSHVQDKCNKIYEKEQYGDLDIYCMNSNFGISIDSISRLEYMVFNTLNVQYTQNIPHLKLGA